MTMLRPLLAAALALALAAPAVAAPGIDASYRATLAAPAATAMVVRDLRWQCAGTACSAPFTATAADSTVCAAVVRKLGAITAFTAGARTFGADEIARCNAAKR